MGDLGQGVRLVHELRQLRGPEELLDGRHDRLGVDQVVRHGGGHLLVDRHLLLDGPLHPHQPDAELVLQQLADGPHAAVPQVIDVVHPGGVLAQAEEVLQHQDEIVHRHHALIQREAGPQLRVHLEAADARQVVAVRVEEHAVEQRPGALERRRIARPQAPVDLDQRLLGRLHGVLAQRVGQDGGDLRLEREEHLEG